MSHPPCTHRCVTQESQLKAGVWSTFTRCLDCGAKLESGAPPPPPPAEAAAKLAMELEAMRLARAADYRTLDEYKAQLDEANLDCTALRRRLVAAEARADHLAAALEETREALEKARR